MFKKQENEYICQNTLSKVQEDSQKKLNQSLIGFLIFLAIAIWVYYSTSGIACFFAMLLVAIPVEIYFFGLLSNYAKWAKYKDLNQRQFLELQMKARKENAEIEKREQQTAAALQTYRKIKTAYKIGQILGGWL